jgi:formate-dependent nitrite reductase membrane component NrfD
VVLVIDLERPERFFYILTRPNWTSWMARGAFLLTAHGATAALWVLLYTSGATSWLTLLAPFAMATAFGATAYTGLLFAQGLARDLWQGPHGTLDLIAQAAAEGSAALLIMAAIVGAPLETLRALAVTLTLAVAAHVLILLIEQVFTPSPTIQHELVVRAVRFGAYRRLFWVGALGIGGLAPLALVVLASWLNFSLVALVPAALVALAGGLAWEYIWVEAGQAVPNS